jgi:hypothetical protein
MELITELDITGRPDDWNRMEFAVPDPQRTMTQVIQNLISDAYEGEQDDGRERGVVEADCPLCGNAWPVENSPHTSEASCVDRCSSTG